MLKSMETQVKSRLKELRTAVGLTQEKFAFESGLSASYWQPVATERTTK